MPSQWLEVSLRAEGLLVRLEAEPLVDHGQAAPLHCGALLNNRLVALSERDKKTMHFVRVDKPHFPEYTAVQGWLKDYAQAVRLSRQAFTNKDASTARLHLVCSDPACDDDAITKRYKKRW